MGFVMIRLLSLARYASRSIQVQRPREVMTRISRTVRMVSGIKGYHHEARHAYQTLLSAGPFRQLVRRNTTPFALVLNQQREDFQVHYCA